MGQAISYCFRCSTQLRDADFEKGRAFRVDANVCCAACAPDSVRLQAQQEKPKKAPPSSLTPRPRTSASQTAIPTVAPSSNRGLLLGGAALGGVALVVVLVLLLSGPSVPPPTPPAPPPAPAPKPVARNSEPSPLDKARQFAREHPDDLEGQIRRFEEVAFAADQTPAGAEARREAEALRRQQREAVDRGLDTLDREIAGFLQSETFGEARRGIEAARHRQRSAQWILAIEKRTRDIDDRLKALYAPLKEKALDARTKGRPQEVDAASARVRSWGSKEHESDLAAALAAVAPPPPPPPPPPPTSAEAKAYLALWEKAGSRAAARDFEGAAADLAAATLSEGPVREERAKDVAELQELGRLYAGIRKALAACREPFLTLRGTSGRVLHLDAERVELQADPRKPTVFVEWNDVPVAFLAALTKTEVPAPLLGLFRALDGESDAAPEGKYRSRQAAAPALPPDELRARELYYTAERDYRAMETRGKALEGYARLLQELKDSGLVKRSRERIERRADGGREYHFAAAELSVAGAFAPMKDGRVATTAAGDGSWIEWEYYARPGTSYRCWVLAGACCGEALDLHYQATGHVETDPKTKKRAPAEPGGGLASPLKAAIRGLKSAHTAKEPKVPAKWDWIEIPLPKAVEGGARRVRLLASAPGFGAAAVVVSALKKKAPTDEELKELAAAAEPAGRAGTPVLLLDDFEQPTSPWSFVGGQEFPGAKGDLIFDEALAMSGRKSNRLRADFSGGGAYVGIWRTWGPPHGWDVRELRVWVKAENVKLLGVRIVDGSDQCHQKNGGVALQATTDWQELVLKVPELVGGEHWGGAKDGKWHPPMKGLGLNIGRGSMTDSPNPKGTVWFDDLRAVLEPRP